MTSAKLDPRTLFQLALAGTMSAASLRVCDAMLPALASDFGRDISQVAGVITIFTIAYAAAQLFFGGLGDRYGKLTVIAATSLVGALLSLATVFAPDYASLLILRALAGVAYAGIMPLAMAHVGDVVPYDQRQATLARVIIGTVIGFTLGQFAGGFLAETIGWRAAFALLALGSLISGLGLRKPARRHPTKIPAHARVSMLRQYAQVLRHRWARTILMLVALEGILLFGALAFIPTHLHGRYGISLTTAGAVGIFYGLGALTYTAIARRAILWLGETRLALCGGILMGAAFALIALQLGALWAYPACFVAGLGFYMFHGALQTNATQMAPEARGTAVAMFALALFCGQSAGVAAAAPTLEILGPGWLFFSVGAGLPALALGFVYGIRRRALR